MGSEEILKHKQRRRGMRLNLRHIVFLSSLVVGLFVYNEILVYHLVIWWNCSYPTLPDRQPSSGGYKAGGKPLLHAMFLADTHLLGRRLGHWFDKLRREWQMRQSFTTAFGRFRPEAVFFLGDVFDEGKWCGPEEWKDYLDRFQTLFRTDPKTRTFVVAGNHDIGFHYATNPYLYRRFVRAFNSTPSGGGVERVSVKGVQFVLVNSMAMQGDNCSLCTQAAQKLDKISEELECLKQREVCEAYPALTNNLDDVETYSRPILLQHFPLFRESDSACGDEADVAPGNERTKAFRSQWDCLSQESTKHLIEKLQPRFVLSGHTHHGCKLKHKATIKVTRSGVPSWEDETSRPSDNSTSGLDTFDVVFDEEGPREEIVEDHIEEWSVASFSWRNRRNPNFILAKITQDQIALSKCYLPEEDSVITLYLFGFTFITLYAIYSRRRFRSSM